MYYVGSMKKKRQSNEKIAIAVGFLSLLIFLPALYDVFQTGSGGVSNPHHNQPAVDDPFYVRDTAILDLETQDIVPGSGRGAAFGDTLYLHYVGQLESGDTFDSSTHSSQPFTVILGSGSTIAGWDIGLVGMQEGGTRRLVIPPELAYGSQEIRAQGGAVLIPANSTLVFDVVLLHVER